MPTFVGRGRELSTLNDLANRVVHECRPAAALVLAPAGQGKSRLLAEAREASGSFVDFRVVGYEPERKVPLAAAADMVRALRDVGEGGRLLREFLSEGPGGSGALSTVRIFEAAHRALNHFTAVRITVDDLQWADSLSVALIHYLVRAADATSQPLLVFAASRPCPVAGAVATSFGEVLGDRNGFEQIELGALEPLEARHLARLCAPDANEERIAAVLQGALGSPFWIGVLAGGDSSADAAASIATRLDGVGPDAKALIFALAVAARPLLAAELRRVLRWPSARTDLAVREAADRGLATEVAGAVRVTHDLIRDAVNLRVDERMRRRLHRALAAELEDSAGDDAGLLLAACVHRRAAGLPRDDICLRIARSSNRRLVGEGGLREMAGCARELGASSAPGLLLSAAVGELAGELGVFDLALEVFSRLADDHPDPALRLKAMLGAGRAAHQLARPGEVRVYVRRIRTMHLDEAARIAVDALEAAVLIWHEVRIPEGSALARSSVERARRLAMRAGGIEGLEPAARDAYLDATRIAFDAALREDSPGILEIADEMMEVARGSDERAYLDAMRHGGVALYEQGRLREAEPRFRRAFDEARRRALPAVEVRTAGYLARTLLMMGRLDDAAELLDGCEATWHRLRDSAYVLVHSQLPRIRAEIEAVQGGWEGACFALERLASAERDPHARLQIERRLLDNLARGGGQERSGDVIRRLECARESSKAAGCPNCDNDLKVEAAEALVRVGRPAEARESLGSKDTYEDDLRRSRPRAAPRAVRRAWVEALIAVEDNRPQAVDALAKVVGTAEGSDQRLDALWARLDLGRTVAPVDRPRAIQTLRHLIRDAEEIGASTHVGLAERELRRLGVRGWRRGPTRAQQGAEALSEREREVARLAASGASNPEIARALFVSRKTVERHMSAALSKLGARNRTELASVWTDEMGDGPAKK